MKAVRTIFLTVLLGVLCLPAYPADKAEEEKSIFEERQAEKANPERLIKFLERADPEKAENLKTLKDEDPEQFELEIAEISEKMRNKARAVRRRKEDAVTRASDEGDWQQPRGHKPKSGEDEGRKGEYESYRERSRKMDKHHPPRKTITCKDIMKKRNDEFIEWLKDNFPQEAEKIEAAVETNPDRAFRSLMPEMMKYRDIFETEKKNPELAELMKSDTVLTHRREEILEMLANTQDPRRKEELTDELNKVVTARFDLIIQKRELKYDEMRRRLAQFEKKIEEKEAELKDLDEQRDDQIEKRVDELLSAKSGDIWQ